MQVSFESGLIPFTIPALLLYKAMTSGLRPTCLYSAQIETAYLMSSIALYLRILVGSLANEALIPDILTEGFSYTWNCTAFLLLLSHEYLSHEYLSHELEHKLIGFTKLDSSLEHLKPLEQLD